MEDLKKKVQQLLKAFDKLYQLAKKTADFNEQLSFDDTYEVRIAKGEESKRFPLSKFGKRDIQNQNSQDITDLQNDKVDKTTYNSDQANQNSEIDSKVDKSSVVQTNATGHKIFEINGVDIYQILTELVDNLTSTATDKALTANQGRILKEAIDNINTILNSDDTTLDELQEIVDYIKQNKQDLQNLSIPNIAGLENALNNLINTVISNPNGSKLLKQGSTDLITISKVGQTGNYGDLIGKPTPSSSVTSNDTTQFANSQAVKTAYDKASEALQELQEEHLFTTANTVSNNGDKWTKIARITHTNSQKLGLEFVLKKDNYLFGAEGETTVVVNSSGTGTYVNAYVLNSSIIIGVKEVSYNPNVVDLYVKDIGLNSKISGYLKHKTQDSDASITWLSNQPFVSSVSGILEIAPKKLSSVDAEKLSSNPIENFIIKKTFPNSKDLNDFTIVNAFTSFDSKGVNTILNTPYGAIGTPAPRVIVVKNIGHNNSRFAQYFQEVYPYSSTNRGAIFYRLHGGGTLWSGWRKIIDSNSFDTTTWKVKEDANGDLVFSKNGTDKGKIDSTGVYSTI